MSVYYEKVTECELCGDWHLGRDRSLYPSACQGSGGSREQMTAYGLANQLANKMKHHYPDYDELADVVLAALGGATNERNYPTR